MTLPRIYAEGGLVADPELRFSNAGKAWVSFRIACRDRQRGQSGEWEDGPSTFLSVVAFGRIAENLINSTVVGDLIAVEGKLQQNDWEDKDGNKRTSYRIVADSVSVSLMFNTATTPKAGGSQPTKAPQAAAAAAESEFPF